jgi:pimeloyl-ACP methyl ester carboxylesterase
MALIKVAGGTLDVVTEGTGRDLVILHSLLLDRTAFDGVKSALSRRFRLHLVALPGFDGSSPVPPAIEAFADRIAELWPALKLGPETAVLGNGFGAMVALTLAIRHGRQFGPLVLADCVARFSDAGRAAVGAMRQKALESGMGSIAEIAARRIFHDAYIESHPEEIERRRLALERMNRDTFIAACGISQNLDLQPGLASVRNPTLVVFGALDQATPPDRNRALAEGLGARAVALPECGHCPPLEKPDVFLATVVPFLETGR